MAVQIIIKTDLHVSQALDLLEKEFISEYLELPTACIRSSVVVKTSTWLPKDTPPDQNAVCSILYNNHKTNTVDLIQIYFTAIIY